MSANLGNVTITGVDEVIKNLGKLGRLYEKNLAEATENMAIRVQQEARRLAPINKIGAGDSPSFSNGRNVGSKTTYWDSYNKKQAYRGRLKSSVEYQKTTSPTEWIVRAGGEPMNNRRGKQNQGQRTTDTIIYAAFVELGTRRAAAQPFLRPALRKNRAYFVAQIRKAMRDTLTKFR